MRQETFPALIFRCLKLSFFDENFLSGGIARPPERKFVKRYLNGIISEKI